MKEWTNRRRVITFLADLTIGSVTLASLITAALGLDTITVGLVGVAILLLVVTEKVWPLTTGDLISTVAMLLVLWVAVAVLCVAALVVNLVTTDNPYSTPPSSPAATVEPQQ